MSARRVKPGVNVLELNVTNLWINRMIGDEQLPDDSNRNPDGSLKAWPRWLQEGKPSPTGRYTFTSWRLWKKDSPLVKSGLLGPVTLRTVECVPLENPHPPKEPLCRFTAKVEWIEMVGQREVKAVPIGTQFEMNWLVGIEILSIEKSAKPFEKKGKVVLLIHSPAMFFGQPAKRVLGKQYAFEVFGEVKGGIPHYQYAEVKGKMSPKKGTYAGDEGSLILAGY